MLFSSVSATTLKVEGKRKTRFGEIGKRSKWKISKYSILKFDNPVHSPGQLSFFWLLAWLLAYCRDIPGKQATWVGK
jgi:hypothetical protein